LSGGSDPRTPTRVGLYFAFVQFFFALTWTVYVIFLPKLAAQAGIPKQTIVYLLMLDQLIFVCTDFAMGVMADRVTRTLGRIGYIVLAVTIASCVAFVLLPIVAPTGKTLLIALTALWAASSSALRAPPLMLLGKYAPQSSVPWLSALSLLGLGIAGAIGPYLTIALRDLDPRVPFALSSLALVLATGGIVWAERNLSRVTASAPAAALRARAPPGAVVFLIAALLLGLAFQVHFSINSAAIYLRHAKPDQLPYLMPVFWVGFNILMLPAAIATRRYGGVAVAAIGALVAALASFVAVVANNLELIVLMQLIAGGGWGCVLMSAVSAALAFGHVGREGRITGALFSALAFAAFVRIALVAAQLDKQTDYVAMLQWLPVGAWTLGGVLLLVLLAKRRALFAPATA
jgi:MFS family permease